jgi:hypothetical protein
MYSNISNYSDFLRYHSQHGRNNYYSTTTTTPRIRRIEINSNNSDSEEEKDKQVTVKPQFRTDSIFSERTLPTSINISERYKPDSQKIIVSERNAPTISPTESYTSDDDEEEEEEEAYHNELQVLRSLGYSNQVLNQHLLEFHNGNISAVVSVLKDNLR